MKKNFDNEKMHWADNKVSLSYFNPNRSFLRYYVNELRSLGSEEKHILEIGCGAGELIKAIKRIYPDFIFQASDISKSSIKQARKHSHGIDFLAVSGEKLPYKTGSIDVVIMNSVLDHMEKPENSVREVFRVLKKKGIFLSATPIEADLSVIHGLFTKFKFFRAHRLKYLGHIHAFNKKTLRRLIKRPGFKIQSEKYGWFYIAQLIDIAYYPLLVLLNRRPEENLGVYSKQNGLMPSVMKISKNILSLIQNIESSINNFPVGFFVYVKAIKK